jgi:hypothetical protein
MIENLEMLESDNCDILFNKNTGQIMISGKFESIQDFLEIIDLNFNLTDDDVPEVTEDEVYVIEGELYTRNDNKLVSDDGNIISIVVKKGVEYAVINRILNSLGNLERVYISEVDVEEILKPVKKVSKPVGKLEGRNTPQVAPQTASQVARQTASKPVKKKVKSEPLEPVLVRSKNGATINILERLDENGNNIGAEILAKLNETSVYVPPPRAVKPSFVQQSDLTINTGGNVPELGASFDLNSRMATSASRTIID